MKNGCSHCVGPLFPEIVSIWVQLFQKLFSIVYYYIANLLHNSVEFQFKIVYKLTQLIKLRFGAQSKRQTRIEIFTSLLIDTGVLDYVEKDGY